MREDGMEVRKARLCEAEDGFLYFYRVVKTLGQHEDFLAFAYSRVVVWRASATWLTRILLTSKGPLTSGQLWTAPKAPEFVLDFPECASHQLSCSV
jgi:hypothetical protein